MTCERCGWPRGYGCSCPTDQVTARARYHQAQARHRAAVELARINDERRRQRAEREDRRAS